MSKEIHAGGQPQPEAFDRQLQEFLNAEIGTEEKLEAHRDDRRRHFEVVHAALHSRGLIPVDTGNKDRLWSIVQQYALRTPKIGDNVSSAAYVCVDYSQRLERGREDFGIQPDSSPYQQKCQEALGEILCLSGPRGDKPAWCAAAEEIFGQIHVLSDVEPGSKTWEARIANLEEQHIWRRESRQLQVKQEQRACKGVEAIFSFYGEHDELPGIARACVEAAKLRHKTDIAQCKQAQVRRARALERAQRLGFDEALVDSVIDAISQHFRGDYC